MMARKIKVPTHRRPSTPGEFIREYLDDADLDLTQGVLAARLGISRANLNAIINGRRAVTPEMAMRLERVLGVGMQTWLNLQAAVDIYDALHSPNAKAIAKLKPLRKPAA
jgi:addiction module HigA family antidote